MSTSDHSARRVANQLLLSCLLPDAAGRESWADLTARPLDWDFIVSVAETQGVFPALCHRLQQADSSQVPASVIEPLRQRYSAIARRNLRLTAELVRIAGAFESGGIRVLAYKGPALAASLHGNVALREFSDLDFIVSLGDFPRVKQIVASLGYQPLFALSAKQEASLLRTECQLDFVNAAGDLVDVHWQLVPHHLPPEFSFEAWWARRASIALAGREFAIFSPEDMVLALAVHASKHLWTRLSWLWDVAESIRVRPQLNWDSLLASARAAHALRALLATLAIVHELLGVAVPDSVLLSASDHHAAGEIAMRFCRDFLEGTPDARGSGQRWINMLRLSDGWNDRLRSAGRYLLASGVEEWAMCNLPDSLFGLYPLVRIARLAGLRPSAASLRRIRRAPDN
jgi:hypothetical protein